MTRRLNVVAALLGLATAIVVVAILVSSGGGGDARPKRAAHDPTAILRGIPQHGILLGDPRAPVLLVEFADPQCPFCRQYAVETWPDIVRRFVRTGKVRMELRLVGFVGPDSVVGGRAITAAGRQNRLWDAAAVFYDRQGQENTGYVTDAFLRGVLGAVHGLDVERAMADRAGAAVKQQLGEVRSMQSRYGITSTPSLLVGTEPGDLRVVSERTTSAQQLGAILDAELAKHI